MTVLSGALLNILDDAGVAVLTLTEGLGPEEFFSSRLTQREVLRQMQVMADTSANVPEEQKQQLIEIDWAGWSLLATQLKLAGSDGREALWFGVNSLVPATLMWLRFYHKTSPDLFAVMP